MIKKNIRQQFIYFKGKREHKAVVNIPNCLYPNKDINIEIPDVSRDHVIVSDTIKIMFNGDIKSTEKHIVLFIMQVEH